MKKSENKIVVFLLALILLPLFQSYSQEMATRYSVEISVNKYNSKTGDIFAESNYKNNSDDENSISQFQFNVLRDIRTND